MTHILGFLVNRESITGRTDISHQFLVENCLACFGRLPDPDDHVLGKVNLAWVRRCRDTKLCDTQESIEWYIRAHIFCILRTVVFSDKSTNSLNLKFLSLLRDFHCIPLYSWGAASSTHQFVSSTERQIIYLSQISKGLLFLSRLLVVTPHEVMLVTSRWIDHCVM
ncbi:hypothetical protein Ahy_A07g034697 [Arachis hypogaea]|uniref:Aminotransferase-like plant mobile domain-containing protein n=1 Tax=Arachis hypogaea TaxID=3818 RepID=A0A445CCH2_ARAHY|nr:hypothetical protein Ahy_A07g034697 [Arachis hypogaea]